MFSLVIFALVNKSKSMNVNVHVKLSYARERVDIVLVGFIILCLCPVLSSLLLHLGIVLRHLAFTLALFRLSLATSWLCENAALTIEEYSPELLHKASRVHGHFGFHGSIVLQTCVTSS